MLHIFGKTIPTKKNIFYSLQKLFGVNNFNSLKICKKNGFNPISKINKLKLLQKKRLVKSIDSSFTIEQDLKKILFDNKEQLLKIKHNRGIRNFNGLPVHGQRTKTNAKTKKRLKQK